MAEGDAPRPAAIAEGDAPLPNPLVVLWAQATAIQSIKAFVPITLDFKASNYSKWRTLFRVTVTKYALSDQLTTEMPPANDDEWLRLDSTVLHWLYGSITFEILDIVMEDPTSAFQFWSRIEALFCDNQKARAMYLRQEFRNLEQGDRSVTEYCHKQKMIDNNKLNLILQQTKDTIATVNCILQMDGVGVVPTGEGIWGKLTGGSRIEFGGENETTSQACPAQFLM